MSTKTAEECERIARRWNAHLVNMDFRVYRNGDPVRPLTGRDVATMLADVVISCLENDVGALNNLVDAAKGPKPYAFAQQTQQAPRDLSNANWDTNRDAYGNLRR